MADDGPNSLPDGIEWVEAAALWSQVVALASGLPADVVAVWSQSESRRQAARGAPEVVPRGQRTCDRALLHLLGSP
jgi:hypothetical protein